MIWVYIGNDLLSTVALVTSIWSYGRARAAVRRIQAIRAAATPKPVSPGLHDHAYGDANA